MVNYRALAMLVLVCLITTRISCDDQQPSNPSPTVPSTEAYSPTTPTAQPSTTPPPDKPVVKRQSDEQEKADDQDDEDQPSGLLSINALLIQLVGGFLQNAFRGGSGAAVMTQVMQRAATSFFSVEKIKEDLALLRRSLNFVTHLTAFLNRNLPAPNRDGTYTKFFKSKIRVYPITYANGSSEGLIAIRTGQPEVPPEAQPVTVQTVTEFVTQRSSSAASTLDQDDFRMLSAAGDGGMGGSGGLVQQVMPEDGGGEMGGSGGLVMQVRPESTTTSTTTTEAKTSAEPDYVQPPQNTISNVEEQVNAVRYPPPVATTTPTIFIHDLRLSQLEQTPEGGVVIVPDNFDSAKVVRPSAGVGNREDRKRDKTGLPFPVSGRPYAGLPLFQREAGFLNNDVNADLEGGAQQEGPRRRGELETPTYGNIGEIPLERNTFFDRRGGMRLTDSFGLPTIERLNG